MGDFEDRVNELIDESLAKRIAANSCKDCDILMLPRSGGILWCPMCGRQRATES